MTTELFHSGDHDTELSAEERLGLIPSITTRAELNEAERMNINAARLWAMRPRSLQNPDLITDAFARELHRRMFNQVWSWAGRFRTSERNLGWEAFRLNEGVRNAFDDARVWLDHATYPLHEVAVRLHHRLVAIHPWPNGNGRHARLMADVLVASRGGEALTWGAGADLVPKGEIRDRYIAAIHRADNGDIKALLEFAQS
jgi:Fic-DOC domain mobile mystery protein B